MLVNLPFAVRILNRVGIERWKLEEEVSEKESFSLPTGQLQRCLNGCEKKRRPFRISIRLLQWIGDIDQDFAAQRFGADHLHRFHGMSAASAVDYDLAEGSGIAKSGRSCALA